MQHHGCQHDHNESLYKVHTDLCLPFPRSCPAGSPTVQWKNGSNWKSRNWFLEHVNHQNLLANFPQNAFKLKLDSSYHSQSNVSICTRNTRTSEETLGKRESRLQSRFHIKRLVFYKSSKATYFATKREYTSRWEKLQPYIPSLIIRLKTSFLITAKIGSINSISR